MTVWPRFMYQTSRIEVTMNGMFGGRADEHPVYVPGFTRYYIDDVLVSKEEYVSAVNAVVTALQQAGTDGTVRP